VLFIRPAKTIEADELTILAIRSEAYWSYDSDYMNEFKEIYKITEDFLRENSTFIVSENDEIIGFYSVSMSKEENWIEYFYIDPQSIGKGYGRIMCEHMKDYCRKMGIKEIFVVTSPQAIVFYEKMGALQVAEVESLLRRGRMIPKLKFELASK
jgi:N-acetylglutamate synthase-like GNAT family acetyltransferase